MLQRWGKFYSIMLFDFSVYLVNCYYIFYNVIVRNQRFLEYYSSFCIDLNSKLKLKKRALVFNFFFNKTNDGF